MYLGTWRSPVAHLLGVQGVAGSNPAVPTSQLQVVETRPAVFVYSDKVWFPARKTCGAEIVHDSQTALVGKFQQIPPARRSLHLETKLGRSDKSTAGSGTRPAVFFYRGFHGFTY